jgi:cyclohexa-1,5-dienecarbonyl-CoA hydratase
MAHYEYFEVASADGIAHITMNRPSLNILHSAMMVEFNGLLESLVRDASLAALVLRGKGKAFSAGVDVADHTSAKIGEMIPLFHGIFRKLAATDALSIAVVHGAALGGGCELACFCDIVLASDKATFGQPEVKLAALAPVAASVLPSKIGLSKAIELTVLGGTINAEEARRIGLVNQVFLTDGFDAQVQAYLDQLRSLSRPVVRLAKRAVSQPARRLVLNELDRNEHIYLNELMKLSDAGEGIAAFMEKRAPKWKHA